jgi:hypothetical protein
VVCGINGTLQMFQECVYRAQRGSHDDWRVIMYHAGERDNVFAKAVAAYCISSATTPIVKNDDEAAKRNAKEAIPFLLVQAAQNNRHAQFYLSYFYEKGIGFEMNYSEGARLCRLAADQGFAPAQCNNGINCENGDGVDRDFGEAIRWYRLVSIGCGPRIRLRHALFGYMLSTWGWRGTEF